MGYFQVALKLLSVRKGIPRNHRQAFLDLLKEVREEANISQVQIAKMLQVPQSFVSKYESGERRIDVLELRAICKAIGMPMTSFLNRFEKLLK